MTSPAYTTAGVLLLGAQWPFAREIAASLGELGLSVTEAVGLGGEAVAEGLAGITDLGALVIVTPPPSLGSELLDVDDAQLENSLEQFLDLFGALNLALPRLIDGAAVVVLSSRGHLGAWGGVHEMAFAGAAAGLLRSVTLETKSRGIRANLIAVELPDAGTASDPGEVADLAAFLVSPASAAVNGELILANGGRSLQMREARDRRAPPSTGVRAMTPIPRLGVCP